MLKEVRQPLVSIIVPIYNMAAYLPKCLDSLRQQTYPHLEFILVDDGSTDSSADICRAYAAEDPRIKFLHQKNGGLSAARNTGLKMAGGAYLGFVDADDWVEPDMYAYLWEQGICSPDGLPPADIAICGYWFDWPAHKQAVSAVKAEKMDTLQALRALLQDRKAQNYAWDKLYKAELFKGIKYPVGKTYEDIATTYKLFMRSKTIVILPQPKYHYMQRHDSIVWSHSLQKALDNQELKARRAEELLKKYPQLEPELLGDQIRSLTELWPEIWPLRQRLTAAEQEKLARDAGFARAHLSYAQRYFGWNWLARLRLYLVTHDRNWAYGMSCFLRDLADLKRWLLG